MSADGHTMTNENRKKKSKKGKGKCDDGIALGDHLHGDPDNMPPLEYATQTTTRVTSCMCLPADIESVHLSTSAHLKSAEVTLNPIAG